MHQNHQVIIAKYARLLQEELRRLLPRKPNEAEFRQPIDRLLDDFCQEAGLTPLARAELTLATGRADAVFNRFVIEYERPGTLSSSLSHSATERSVKQVKDYITGLAKRQKQHINRIAGVAFDGHYLVFVRYREGDFIVEAPTPATQSSLERFLRWLASLASGIALTAENLNRDFNIQHPRTQTILRALVEGLGNSLEQGNRMVENLFKQWQLFFSQSIDYSEAFGGRKLDALQQFARRAGLASVDAEQFFFCLHTFFALLVKFIAWLALSRHLAVKLGAPSFGALVTADSETLRCRLAEMESGGIFRHYGITNLLEGDFFAWYLYAWNDRIEEAIRQLLQRLDEYDPLTLAIVPEESRPLQAALPLPPAPRDSPQPGRILHARLARPKAAQPDGQRVLHCQSKPTRTPTAAEAAELALARPRLRFWHLPRAHHRPNEETGARFDSQRSGATQRHPEQRRRLRHQSVGGHHCKGQLPAGNLRSARVPQRRHHHPRLPRRFSPNAGAGRNSADGGQLRVPDGRWRFPRARCSLHQRALRPVL
ncbi:MAG: hypothetical protein NZ960_06510 [Candidatus Kapabacteria bacterium]|nr:hypothetical protein [Candidatus Kapabacteria bacterium]MDW8012773.1 hypothetical protein [Bacteroidota bacterium]